MSARADPRGGRSAMVVPTATDNYHVAGDRDRTRPRGIVHVFLLFTLAIVSLAPALASVPKHSIVTNMGEGHHRQTSHLPAIILGGPVPLDGAEEVPLGGGRTSKPEPPRDSSLRYQPNVEVARQHFNRSRMPPPHSR
jgi:hypothetical protein